MQVTDDVDDEAQREAFVGLRSFGSRRVAVKHEGAVIASPSAGISEASWSSPLAVKVPRTRLFLPGSGRIGFHVVGPGRRLGKVLAVEQQPDIGSGKAAEVFIQYGGRSGPRLQRAKPRPAKGRKG